MLRRCAREKCLHTLRSVQAFADGQAKENKKIAQISQQSKKQKNQTGMQAKRG